MSVFVILENLVCRDQLFSLLEVNDLLRMRRVSKAFKEEAEDFIRIKKVATKRVLQFDLWEDDPFEQFNEFRNRLSGLPIRTGTRVSFSTDNNEILQQEYRTLRQNFLETYGSRITYLELYGLQLPIYSEAMFQLFDPFPNLTYLGIETCYAPAGDEIPPDSSASSQEIKIPVSLSKLKRLKIFVGDSTGSTVATQQAFDFMAKLVDTCLSSLDLLELPWIDFTVTEMDMRPVKRLLYKCFCNAPNLKLCVYGQLLEELFDSDDRTPEMGSLDEIRRSINEKVVSITYPLFDTFNLELPNLKELILLYMDCEMPGTDEFVRRNWPNLKHVIVNFEDREDNDTPKFSEMWDFLFGNWTRRENTIKLWMGFEGFDERNITEKELTLPRTMELTMSCPNLKILHFDSEIKQLVNLQPLWRAFTLLEELGFSECKDLNDTDLMGKDPNYPALWHLKKLKTLKLLHVQGTQLTDDLFRKAIVHMPLRKLILSSHPSHPDQHSFTLGGIKSLLAGQFSNTIEKLDITCLNLGPVSAGQRKQVESLFRSSRMI